LSTIMCIGVIAAGVVLIVVAKNFRASAAAASRKELEVGTAEKALNVKVQVLEAKILEDRLLLTGSVKPWEDVQLSAEVAGKIEWQGVEEGDTVEAGQELVKIDTDAIRARLNQARAQYDLTVQELVRAENLQKEGIGSPQDLDRALTDREVALANLRTTQIELDKSVLRAPFDGVVDELSKEEAEFVSRGTSLARLVQVHKVKVDVGIPERDVPFFAKGDAVTVTADALPAETFHGTIYRIATTADAHTRTFITEIELDNADGRLKPGMIARARLVRKSYLNAISIPIFAVLSLEGGYRVFIEENGVAQPRDVEVGIFQDNMVHVTRGLDVGDRLIVVGQRDLRAGDPVRVVEEIVE